METSVSTVNGDGSTVRNIEDIIQNDLGINVSSVSQGVADFILDMAFREALIKYNGVNVDRAKFIMTSAIVHGFSEIAWPAVVREIIVPHIIPIPVIGPAIYKILSAINKYYGVGVVLKVGFILILQYALGGQIRTEAIDAAIMSLSELIIDNTIDHVPAIKKEISYKF